nr:hypothetical protein [Lysinibacillus timonensis]
MLKIIQSKKFIILVFSLCAFVIFLLTMKINNVRSEQKEYIYQEIHYPLYLLNAAITDQRDIGWEEPQIIINQLDKVRTSILSTVKFDHFASDVLNKDEVLLLEEIYEYLKRLPQNELFELAKWDDEDTDYVDLVGEALSHAGFDLRESNPYEWEDMVKQWRLLEQALSEQLK